MLYDLYILYQRFRDKVLEQSNLFNHWYTSGNSAVAQFHNVFHLKMFSFFFLFMSPLQDHPRAEYEFRVMQKSLKKEQKKQHKVILEQTVRKLLDFNILQQFL